MTTPRRPATKPPASARQFAGAFHMLARHYQDYEWGVHQAAKREGSRRSLDVDGQRSSQGTGWALHWSTLGRNKLHDPKKKYGPETRIDSLTDAEIARMHGPDGQKTHRLSYILRLAHRLNVRVEMESKVVFPKPYAASLSNRWFVKSMIKRGDFQVKTLAGSGDPVPRLTVWHDAGAPTILSFTDYRGPGISKKRAWPVTDYTRGTPKWTT